MGCRERGKQILGPQVSHEIRRYLHEDLLPLCTMSAPPILEPQTSPFVIAHPMSFPGEWIVSFVITKKTEGRFSLSVW